MMVQKEHWYGHPRPASKVVCQPAVRLTRVAGFEWGSGFYINPVPPEDAAGFLREIENAPTLPLPEPGVRTSSYASGPTTSRNRLVACNS